jgi:hypothetical protein
VALYSTAFGIIVAVPSVLAYRIFRSRVDDFLVELEQQAQRLVDALYGEMRAEPRPPGAAHAIMKFRRGYSEDPELNLIPLIDVLLVVLIFLAVSTSYSHFSQLQIELPNADPTAAGRQAAGNPRRHQRRRPLPDRPERSCRSPRPRCSPSCCARPRPSAPTR